MIKFNLSLAAVLFLASTSFAAPVLSVKEDSGLKISGTNIPIYKSAEIKSEGKLVSLLQVGNGVRKKFSIVKVYGGELYATSVKPFRVADSELPLKALDANDVAVVAIQMSFVHEASLVQLESAYKEGFARNGVDVTSELAIEFLKIVDLQGPVSASDGTQTITVIGEKLSNGLEKITYQNSLPPQGAKADGEILVGKVGTIKGVFSAWLGNTTGDNDLGKFQSQLVKEVAP